MVLQDRAVIRRDGELPFYSFKPNLLRYTKHMAEKACHVVGSTTQVGLTQVLGLPRQIIGAEMFRSLALLAIAAFIGFAHQAVAGSGSTADPNDAAKIYAAFLDGWTGKEKNPINVSIVAKAPTAEALKEFSDCADKTQWMPVESVNDLTGLIGKLTYVRLVDPSTWNPSDPHDLIAQGQSVESAVDSGFDNGLATFSAIAFDESHITAAFTFSFVCGGLCGSGRTVIYELTPAGWIESDKQCGSWISQVQRGRPNNSFKPNLLRYTKHMAG